MARTIPEVSVVIPAYNAADFIREQLDALLSGTFLPGEIVVSDNGSTDTTASLVQSYVDSVVPVRVVDSSSRQGVSYARNKGAEEANGKKLLICDADDVVDSRWVEQMSLHLDSCDLVGSGYQHLVRQANGDYTLGHIFIHQPEVFNGNRYLLGGIIGFRRDVFESLHGFDMSYIGGHDEVDFCLRASAHGYTQGWIPEPLILYRQRPSHKGLAKQSRNYGRTWIQLAQNFSPIYDHHVPSLKLMIRKVVPQVPSVLLKKQMSWEELRGFYWNVGRLEGVIKYRVFRRTPQRNLYSSVPDSPC